MDENVKNKQLSDEELDNVTGGEKRELRDGYYYVNEERYNGYAFYCPKCEKSFCVPSGVIKNFRYNYGVSGGHDIYCPDCYPEAFLKPMGHN